MSDKPPAIIIGLDSMQGIQVARILASHGVPVYAITNNPSYHTTRTRVCRDIMHVDTGTEDLVDLLLTIGSDFDQKPVLVPCQDKNVLVISRSRDRLERFYRLVLPPNEVVEMMMDKVRFYTYAQEQGFPLPRTFILRTRDEAETAAEKLDYPCVLKPPFRPYEWTRHTKQKALVANDPEELLGLYDHYRPWADLLIAQEWIEGTDGDLYSCNVYFNASSEPIVTFVARKIRQWPPETGQSSSGEECRADPVLDETVRLFRTAGFQGLGYLEMKRDARSGAFVIVEPNVGRPTGRSAIAEAGGVDLHYAMYCDAAGLPLPEGLTQRYLGVKWVHLLRDIQSGLHYWRRGELTIPAWFRSLRGRRAYALFSWTDPMPFLTAMTRAIPALLSPRERGKEDYEHRSAP